MYEVYWFDYGYEDEFCGKFESFHDADEYIMNHGGYDGTYGESGYVVKKNGEVIDG